MKLNHDYFPMISHVHQAASSLNASTYHILLIEDEPAEIYLVQDAIASSELAASITLPWMAARRGIS